MQLQNGISTERVDYIDVFRGFGIIIMIMGHIGFGREFDYFIHAFHMPMFFFISGFMYKKKDVLFNKFVVRKAKSLLVPYILFGLIYYVIWVLVKEFSFSPLLHLVWINTEGLPITGALWFLTALFFTDIIYFLINHYCKNKIFRWGIIVGISIIGTSLKTLTSITLPYALGCSFVGVGLFHIGYCISTHKENYVMSKILNMNLLTWLIMTVCTIILIFINGYINMRMEEYSVIPLFWINAIFSILVGLNIAKFTESKIKKFIKLKYIKSIGCNSIIYVCLNEIIIWIISMCFNVVNIQFVFPKSIVCLIKLFISIILLYNASIIILTTKLKFLVGKQIK